MIQRKKIMPVLDFSLNLPAAAEKLMELATDYENSIRFLPPEQIKSIKVLERNDDETLTEEVYTFQAINFHEISQRSIHTKTKPDTLNTKIISGPLKGTEVQIQFEKIDSGAKISIKANLKLGLKYRVLGPLVKNKYKLFLTAIMYKMVTAANQ